jgi:hypothetical protein
MSVIVATTTWGWGAWAWLMVPLAVYAVISLLLFAMGRTNGPGFSDFFFGNISDSLRRATGFPGWSMAGVLSGLLFLLVLVIGFYWDVAWHIDNGRDIQLLTPSHTMILVGLGGIVYTAYLTMLFATLEEVRSGIRVAMVRVPWSSLLLLALGMGGLVAFPLDNLWHKAYGLDVTLWSPTHLQLLGGGTLATIALFLMCAEALPDARPTMLGRFILALTGGTVLVALSTFMGEFEFGIPQFQALYLPILIVVAGSLALVLGRLALGRWGAVKMVAAYLVLRVFLALAVGGALGHSVPRFALYLPSALLVEGAAAMVGTRSRLRLAVVAGALIGTVGLACELAWLQVSGWATGSLPTSMLVKMAVVVPLAGVAAAVLGAGIARAFRPGGSAPDRMPVAALALAGVALVGVLAYPLPRNVGDVEGVIRTEAVGDRAFVEVSLEPASAADDAIAFAVTSWQGGGLETVFFDKVAPGLYRSKGSVPVTGRWKSVVSLQRGDQLMAAPVYLPDDPKISAVAVPLAVERRVMFVRNTELLLREQHSGPTWPAVAVWTGFGLFAALWAGLIGFTAYRVSPRDTGPGVGARVGQPEFEVARSR